MSYTSICVADTDGVMHVGRQFRNSWGGAWFIWDSLYRAYLPPTTSFLLSRAVLEQVWALARAPHVSVEERITLVTTFDRCLIHRQDCYRVATALDAFVRRHERRRGDRACHLPLQALYLRELATSSGVREVGWQQTSVAQALWHVVDKASGKDRPYNVVTDTGHWFLFEDYPELAGVPVER